MVDDLLLILGNDLRVFKKKNVFFSILRCFGEKVCIGGKKTVRPTQSNFRGEVGGHDRPL